MALKDQFSGDLDNVFFNVDDFAESVTYVALATQINLVIDVIVDYGEVDRDANRATLYFKRADIPLAQHRDSVWIDGLRWYVERIIENERHIIEARIYKDPKARAKA